MHRCAVSPELYGEKQGVTSYIEAVLDGRGGKLRQMHTRIDAGRS